VSSPVAAPLPRPAPVTRLLGGVLIALATAVVAVVEVFFVVLRFGTVRAPVSIVLAVILHPLLTRAMRDTTGSRLAVVVPLAVWIGVVVPFSASRAEGDLILTGETVSYAYLLIAMGAFIVAIFRLLPPRGANPPAGSLGGDGAR
jgi:hypothetical protein